MWCGGRSGRCVGCCCAIVDVVFGDEGQEDGGELM